MPSSSSIRTQFHLLQTAYINQDLDLLRGLALPEQVISLFACEWVGSSDVPKDLWPLPGISENEGLHELLTAHRALHDVKTGAWALKTPQPPKESSPLVDFIYSYALFSKAFYADHREAWKSLLRLALRALRLRKPAAVNMCVYLAGHMLVIDGARRFGYMIARQSLTRSLRCLNSGQLCDRFFHNIVVAAFPFALFISMVRDKKAEALLSQSEQLLAKDAYYQTIFLNGALCYYAFRGNVGRSEILSHRLLLEQQGANLPRYVVFAEVMVLLPLALAGYAHLAKDRLDSLLAEDDAATDPRLKSEYLRAAGIISLYLGDPQQAVALIRRAQDEGHRTEFAKVWKRLDNLVLECAAGRRSLESASALLVSEAPPNLYQPDLSRVLQELIFTTGSAPDSVAAYCLAVADLLENHLQSGQITIEHAVPPAAPDVAAIRFAGHFLALRAPPASISALRRRLDGLKPILSTLERLHADVVQSRRARAATATGDLARQVAHDIRSPLAALEIVASVCDAIPKEERELLQHAARRIKNIADQLLTSGSHRVADSKERHAAQVVNVANVVHALCAEKRQEYSNNPGVSILVHGEHGYHGTFATICPIELQRCISNLINNGMESLDANGTVIVEVTRHNADVVVSVRDTGQGIPPEVIPRLFARGATFGKSAGNGLGLHHAKNFAEQAGGSIAIDSEVGTGTTITLKLPSVPPPPWFVHQLRISPNSQVVVLHSEAQARQVWDERISAAANKGEEPEVMHVSSPSQLLPLITEARNSARPVFVLADHQLHGAGKTGLDVLISASLGAAGVLLSDHHDDPSLHQRCEAAGIRILPKSMAARVPLEIHDA